MDWLLVKNIIKRSIPIPIPEVGGIPYSKARKKSSSINSVSYYTSIDEANNGTNPIANSISFTSSGQTIYVRVESTDTGCATVFPLTLYVNFLKSHGIYNDVYECDDISGDGIENFLPLQFVLKSKGRK